MDRSRSYLTYPQLTEYYNDLVLQLKLAEHNLNVTIDLEIKETNKSKSLERERQIITLLKESVSPALEITVSYLISYKVTQFIYC